MRAMPVVVVEERVEALGALFGVGVGVCVSPFAQRGLDEALGLAVSLWGVGACEAVLEAESGDDRAHGVGAIAGAVVGVDALGGDAVPGKEGEGGVEESDGTASGLVGEELGEGEAGMVVDGDVEELPTGARGVIVLAIAGDAMAWAHDAGELFDIEMDEFARMLALIAAEGRRRLEGGELFGVAAQEARNRGPRDLGGAGDLEARQLAAAQRQDGSPVHLPPLVPSASSAGDAERVGGFGGTFGTRTAITQTGVPLGAEAREPFEDRANGDAQSSGDCGGGLMKIENAMDEFRSTARGKLGSTVQGHAALDFGSVLISQPHLSRSSPHEQPIGTSHLARIFHPSGKKLAKSAV